MKTVLITGATSGIGKALAHQFADAGYLLVLHGRNQKKLDKTCLEFDKNIVLLKIISDLSDKQGSQKIIDNIKEKI